MYKNKKLLSFFKLPKGLCLSYVIGKTVPQDGATVRKAVFVRWPDLPVNFTKNWQHVSAARNFAEYV